MRFSNSSILPLTLLYLAGRIFAQSPQIITVAVGDDGSFYSPNNFTASNGTVINFQFVGTAHAVVQADNTIPCLRLEGGFDSGISGLKFGGSLSRPIEWNLTITNDSAPIWFYCKAQMPVPHCQAGMVGVINPPSQQDFKDYINLSKNASVTTQPLDSSIKGIGAMATGPPIGPGKNNAGPIIGGVVGGVAAIAVVVVLVLLLLHQKKKARILEDERLAIDGSSWLSAPSMGQGWRQT